MILEMSNISVYGLKESIIASGYPMEAELGEFERNLTEKDWKRVGHLARAKAGSGHDCFLKGIIVQFDLKAPEYFWRQFDRYHFRDYVSSQSKMHRITKMNIEDNCNKWVDNRVIGILDEKVQEYKNNPSRENFQRVVSNIPSGFMLTARITTNFLQLKSILSQRQGHKLMEWEGFVNAVRNDVPYYVDVMEEA